MSAFHNDSRWSWLVLVAGIMAFGIGAGVMLSYGVYYLTYMESFDATNREATMVGALAYGFMLISGTMGGFMGTHLGHARVVFIGGTLAVIGYIASAFMQTIYHLTATQSLVGFALGLMMPNVVAVQTVWFARYRYLAVGLVTVGGALGTFVFPPLFVVFIERYTWRGSMLLNAGIALQLYVCAAVMRPRPRQTSLHDRDDGEDANNNTDNMLEVSAVLPQPPSRRTVGAPSNAKRTLWVDVVLISKSPPFWLLCLSCCGGYGGNYVYFSMVAAFIVGRRQSVDVAARLISVTAVASLVGRIAAAVLGQMPGTHKTLLLAAGFATTSAAILATLWCTQLGHFVVVCCAFGLGFGVTIASTTLTIMEVFGAPQLANVQGLVMSGAGLGIFCIPQLAGWLVDEHNGAIEPAFVVAVVSTSSAALLTLVIQLIIRRRKTATSTITLDPLCTSDVL